MRILQLNSYADPIGGAEVYALALTRELARRGHTVAFFGTSPDHEENTDVRRVVRRPRYDAGVLYRDERVRTALDDTLAAFRPELVHVHNVYSLGLDVLERLGSAKAPVVQTVHDFSLLCPNSWCVRGDGTICPGGAGTQCFLYDCQANYPYDAAVALHTLLKHRLLNAIVDLSICPSQYLAERMRANGSRQVRHLNYFIEPIPSEEGLAREPKHLVFIGRLQREKGVEHLLEAMPIILREDPEVRLTVVGGGDLQAELQAQSKALRLGAAVSFRNHVPREQLGTIYGTATACVLPSIWSENSPLVAYECLAAGLPILASRIGGIPELAVDGITGFTFAPRDPRDLAAQALRLLALGPRERAEMERNMRTRSLQHRALQHVERIEELYREIPARVPVADPSPRVALDDDLLFLLARLAGEKSRLGALFEEHVTYIRHLEKAIADARNAQSPEENRRLLRSLQNSLEQHRRRLQVLGAAGPKHLLRRIARALRLPKVFKS